MNSGDGSNLVTSVQTTQGFWQMGILWTPLISSEQTKGQYSAMEQLMPQAAGPPPHVHDHGEEVFYILDGELAMQLGEQVITAGAGQMVRVPVGIPHAFAVTTETARVLNLYVPGGLDLQVAMLGTPATTPTLPPEGAERSPSEQAQQAFTARLHDLATQTMASTPDLLTRHRISQAGADQHMP